MRLAPRVRSVDILSRKWVHGNHLRLMVMGYLLDYLVTTEDRDECIKFHSLVSIVRQRASQVLFEKVGYKIRLEI